jgi:NAD+ diphosphatase
MSERTFRYCPRCATPLGERDDGGRPRKACPAEGCGYVFYDNPLPVVAALVELDGKVILARGKGWPAGMFGLITGFLERDETPEQGVLRELREELSLEGRVVELIGLYPFPQRNELIVAFHVEARGEIVLDDEIEEIKRVDPARLRPWPFGTGLAVADWVARRSAP